MLLIDFRFAVVRFDWFDRHFDTAEKFQILAAKIQDLFLKIKATQNLLEPNFIANKTLNNERARCIGFGFVSTRCVSGCRQPKKKQEKKYRKEYCHRSLFTVNAFKFKVQKQKEKEDTMNV